MESDSDTSDDRLVKEKRIRTEDLVLNQYESQIAMEVVAPEDIPVGFEGWIPTKYSLICST